VSTQPAVDKGSAYYELIKRISLREKASLAAEILLDYVRVRRLLWKGDLTATVTTLRSVTPPVQTELRDRRAQAVGVRLGKAVGRTLHLLPFDSRCLVRSLVLTSMLARRGIPATLVIGVSIEPEFAAHAWVESEGIALLPTMDDSYRRLVEM
jgi:Transglutaminase-like superfamily